MGYLASLLQVTVHNYLIRGAELYMADSLSVTSSRP